MPKRSIEIASLDVGRFYADAEVMADTLRIMDFIHDPRWDAICLHGLPVYVTQDDNFKKRWPANQFCPMTNHIMLGGIKCRVGNGVFSRLRFVSTSACAYIGAVSPVLDLDSRAVTISRIGNANAKNHVLLEKCESRIAVFATIKVDGLRITIGKDDSPWRPVGSHDLDDNLREGMVELARSISKQEERIVIAGGFKTVDSEASRLLFGESKYFGRELHACLPPVKTTVDWNSRGKKGPDLVVDYFLRAGPVIVSKVEAHEVGGKNLGISATVEW